MAILKIPRCFSARKITLTAGYFPRLVAIIYIPDNGLIYLGL